MDELYRDLLVRSIQLILDLAIPVILALVYKALAKARENEEWRTVENLVRHLVLRAEYYGVTGVLKNIGEEKKKWVLEEAEKALAERGIVIDMEQLSDMIEAQLMDAINKYKYIR